MLTVPTALWPHLVSQALNPIDVYEIEPIDRLGAVEHLGNGDFESWSGAPLVPSGWAAFPNSATITKETALMRTGAACVKFTYTSTTFNSSVQNYGTTLTPATWVHVEAWFRSSVIRANCVGIRIVNLAGSLRELKSDMTWSAGNTGLFALIATPTAVGTYQRVSFWFKTEATAGVTDSYAFTFELIGTAGWVAGDVVHVDSASIEGGYERPMLFFSSQSLTWNGDTYTGLTVERGPIKKSMEFRVTDCTVKFSSVSNLLRQYLYPVDMLGGARLTVRTIFRDASFVLVPDHSIIPHKGRIEPIKRITETEFPMTVRGLLDGLGVETPAWRLALTCGWQFANGGAFDGGGHCAYIQSTTTSGAVSNSTTIPLTAASTFQNGDSIQIAGGTAVTIVSGGGTTTLVVSAPQTCAGGASVRYADCPGRSITECDARAMRHRFGGNSGVSITSRIGRQVPGLIKTTAPNRPGGRNLPQRTPTPTSQSAIILRHGEGGLAGPFDPVPVLYGRRRIRPIVVELVQSQSPALVKTLRTLFCILSVGTIAGVVRYFVDGVVGNEQLVGGTGDKLQGIYVRLGGPGLNDQETIAEYIADSTTIVRTQNFDYRSFANLTYSEKGYLILLRNDSTLLDPDFAVEAKGREIQLYDAAGAPVGAAVFSENPIWQCIDWTTQDYALGGAVADVDVVVSKAEGVDIAGALITSTEASTKITANQGAPSTTCDVENTEGLIHGRRVDVNGVANTVDYVETPTRFYLGTAVVQSIGQAVVQRPMRFESHIYIAQSDRGTRHLASLLASCRGYVTDDAGRIQFRIERDHCKSRITNGNFEAWAAPAAAPDGWAFNNGGGIETIARDSVVKHGGLYSMKLTRSDGVTYAGPQFAIVGLEPGRFYHVEFWHLSDAAPGIGQTSRCFFSNDTKGLSVDADGLTWGVSLNLIAAIGTTTWTRYEATCKIREDFALSDSYTLRFPPYFSAGHSVWFDDALFRGPYAGDFREFTTDLLMGWKEGSFEWSLDKRDRETNRVTVRFLNESGQFGEDEAVANDFEHQKFYPVKTLTIDAPSVCDRDQASRLAAWALAKRRELGPGCSFLGSPPALALQPGDVILVSHTVPGWICKEQRVIETEVLGLKSPEEHFVRVDTEDYLETIYPDTAPAGLKSPPRVAVNFTLSVDRNSGGVLDLSWVADATVAAISRFHIHSSATSGFTPDDTNNIGSVVGTEFIYTLPKAQLEQVRYYRVIAMTEYGPIASAQLAITVYAVDYDATDATQGENDADKNLIYDSGFQGGEFTDGVTKNGDGWLVNTDPAVYTPRLPTSHVTPSYTPGGGITAVAFTNPANAYDAEAAPDTPTTQALGSSNYNGTADNVASMKVVFPAATRTGRGRVVCRMTTAGQAGTVKLYYTVDGGTNWIQFATVTNALTNSSYYTPRFVSQSMANFSMEARVEARQSLPNNTTSFNWGYSSFDEESAGAVIVHLVNGWAELNSDGTRYAEVRRRFPEKNPPANGFYLTSTTPNRWEIKAKRLISGAPVGSAVEVVLQDVPTGREWLVASIAPGDIVNGPNCYQGLFSPSPSPVSGMLDIVIRTKSSNGCRVTQVVLDGRKIMGRYQPSVDDPRLADRSIGDAIGWPKGKLSVGGYRKVAVTP